MLAVARKYIFLLDPVPPKGVHMMAIEPYMVLGKTATDPQGASLGEIVDVGLHNYSRVKFLVVEDKVRRVPIRTVSVDQVEGVSTDTVRLRVG